jgi:hypothetical protein
MFHMSADLTGWMMTAIVAAMLLGIVVTARWRWGQ